MLRYGTDILLKRVVQTTLFKSIVTILLLLQCVGTQRDQSLVVASHQITLVHGCNNVENVTGTSQAKGVACRVCREI